MAECRFQIALCCQRIRLALRGIRSNPDFGMEPRGRRDDADEALGRRAKGGRNTLFPAGGETRFRAAGIHKRLVYTGKRVQPRGGQGGGTGLWGLVW